MTASLPTGATMEAGWRAVGTLYHRWFTGLLLTIVSRRSAADAGEFTYGLFRRQHLEKFLPGIEKLGLSGEPDAVKAAGYHYLSNGVGGVKVQFMRESDRKAWVHFVPPRWIYDGVALCGIPSDVSRGVLRGWYAHNGISLGNPKLGFICTQQTTDGQPGLSGYFLEHDRPLNADERLRFSPGELPPRFDPAAAPKLSTADWTPERLAKASRNYAMDYIKNGLPVLASLFGPEEAARLGHIAAVQIGMQFYDEMAKALGVKDDSALSFAKLWASLAAAQDDPVSIEVGQKTVRVRTTGWRLMRGVAGVPGSAFDAWNGLFEGMLSVHDRFLRVQVRSRMDQGDDAFEWEIGPRGSAPVF